MIIKVFETCERCGKPTRYVVHRHGVDQTTSIPTYNFKDLAICGECNEYLRLGRRDNYRRQGSDFGVDCVGRIKVQIWHETFDQHAFNWHRKEHFTFTAYCDALRPKEKKEFQIRQDFNNYYWHTDVMPKDFFVKKIQGKLSMVKTPEKLMLLTSEDFLNFLYDCMYTTQSDLCKQILYEYGI